LDRELTEPPRRDAAAGVNDSVALRVVKVVHTAVWAFFVTCIVAVPVLAGQANYRAAAIAAGLVMVEALVLAVNRYRCPLTDVAARYTDDRAPNFDIYLPLWVARYNKEIFGPLYLAGLLFAFVTWLLSS
jgi:hypothetical protein